MEIKTNNVPRPLESAMEIENFPFEEFDYLDNEEYHSPRFFQYKGQVYDAGDMMRAPESPELEKWDAIHNETFFSGILVCLCYDNDSVIVGSYYC